MTRVTTSGIDNRQRQQIGQPPSPSREQTIRQAWANLGPPPIPPAPGPTDTMGLAGHVVRSTLDEPHAIGGMSKLVGLLPPSDREVVKLAVNLIDHEQELGRHGNSHKVHAVLGTTSHLDRAVVDKVVDGLTVDYVTATLLGRMGSDLDIPPPPLDRRDVIDAAIDAHSAPSTQET